MLKKRTTLTTLLITAMFLIGGAFTALAAAPDGSFDDFEGSTIVGWGWDSSLPNTGVPVTVTITNKETGEQVKSFHQTAVTYRSDLEESGIGNGRHGFRINMNWDALADGTYVVEGTVDGKALSNPKTYVKGEAAQTSAENISAEDSHEHTGLKSLGFFRTTGYCPCKQCSEGWGRRTSTGTIATSGRTIAVDPRVIPYGSKVVINGQVYVAEDCGGAIKHNCIDIYVATHQEGEDKGVYYTDVYLLK